MSFSVPDPDSAPAQPSLALAAYVERFVEGRRVAVFGDATSGLGAELARRGARLVHVYDPDAARTAEALRTQQGRGVNFAQLHDGDLGVRDGAFDVTIVPDLTMAPSKALLSRVRQMTAAGGLAIVATPRASGALGAAPLSYYDFYEAVALQFSVVQMVGQVAFQGYALVDFALEGEPEVVVDASLADAASREPAFYVAVASERKVAIDAYAIVQLPTAPASDGGPPLRRALEASALALTEAKARAEALRVELEMTREAKRGIEARHAEEQRRTVELSTALSETRPLSGQLAQHQQRASELEARAVTEGRRAEQLEGRLVEERRRAEQLAGRLAEEHRKAEQLAARLGEEQGRTAKEVARLAEEHGRTAREATRRADEQGKSSQEALRRAEALGRSSQDAARVIAELEARLARLKDAPRVISELEGRLARMQEAPRVIAELEARLARLQDAPRVIAELEARLARLQEGPRVIAELEARLARMQEAPRVIAELEARLARLQDAPRVIAELEGRLVKTTEALERALRELRTQQERAAQGAQKLAEAQAEIARLKAREAEVVARLRAAEGAAKGVDAAEHEGLRQQARALAERAERAEAEAHGLHDEHAAEIHAGEVALRERARELSKLRHEVDRRGAMVRELLEALEGHPNGNFGPAPQGPEGDRAAELERQLRQARGHAEELITQATRRDNELRAALARVQELTLHSERAEHEAAAARAAVAALMPASHATPVLGDLPAAPAPASAAVGSDPAPASPEMAGALSAPADELLTAAHAEIDALRRALLQERKARLEAEGAHGGESGDFAAVLHAQVDAENGG